MSNLDDMMPIPTLADYGLGDRLLADGAASLTNAELLATILVTAEPHETALQLAERVIAASDGLYGLAQADASELREVAGLASSKLAQILAVIELSKRLIVGADAQQSPILTAADAARCVADMGYLRQEHVRVILLNSARRVIGLQTVYIGTVNMSILRIAEVFRDALIHNSPAIILAHNHPSGDPSPSPEDVEVTLAAANAGRLLDITLIDHIILSYQRWVSLRDLGFAF